MLRKRFKVSWSSSVSSGRNRLLDPASGDFKRGFDLEDVNEGEVVGDKPEDDEDEDEDEDELKVGEGDEDKLVGVVPDEDKDKVDESFEDDEEAIIYF